MDSNMDTDSANAELVSGMDIVRNFEKLKDAISSHFSDIRRVETCLGEDHAELLQRHIDQVESGRASTPMPEEPTEQAVVDPWPDRFTLGATSSSKADMGLFRLLPQEIRDLIYDYALCVDFPDNHEMCNCARPCKCAREYRSGLGLLQTCKIIYQECLPRLYQENIFGLSVGYQYNSENEESLEWADPVFYVHLGVERHVISYPPHNVFHLVRRLEINFINEALLYGPLLYDDEHYWPFVEYMERYRNSIEYTCDKLKNCTQLQLLDVTLIFGSKFADIEYMERLLNPFKKLRGIQEARITVHGHEHITKPSWPSNNFLFPDEPRWTLNEDFADFLERSMTLAHNELLPETNEYEIFTDYFQIPKGDEEAVEEEHRRLLFRPHNDENEMMKAYLRDVYNTDDPNFLNGNMPIRWRHWLQKKYIEKRTSDWDLDKTHEYLLRHPRPLASTAWVIDSTSENKGLRWVPEKETIDSTDERDLAFRPDASYTAMFRKSGHA